MSKTEWPELVGLPAQEAEAKIKEENSNLTVHILPELSPVTMDYREDRVRIFTNAENKVSQVPRTG
ncbi:hypothetical protein LOTGIDRAFT_230585 [Lottia gigantea]|uniref:Subtilisin inhibitor domain-containing protein n=1 Tax=Lottia gigantea TaxID=225164 RepID=V4ADV9_LOTGI|nr:hypothetical protein LOTGIDRAFT_230585 [Lottia gigantea]ESP02199.1 hypothetical protein LOTGIDRAFT_230585 [Lottia gigantea]